MVKNGGENFIQQSLFDRSPASEREPATDLMKAVARKAPVKRKIKRDFSAEEVAEISGLASETKSDDAESEDGWSDLKTEMRERTRKVKKLAREMEKGNRSKLIFFPSYSRKSAALEWYKLGDFSALYFAYRMADRMGRTPKVMRDTDRFSRMNAIVSIRNIEDVLATSMKLGDFDKYEKTVDEMYILYLKQPLSDEEVGILRRTEEQRREMMHNVLKPKKADAAVYQAILTLDRQVLPRTSAMEKGYYVAIGDTMAKQIHQMTQVYFKFANGRLQADEAKDKMYDIIDCLLAGVALLGENSVWGYDAATSIGENIINLKRLIEKMR